MRAEPVHEPGQQRCRHEDAERYGRSATRSPPLRYGGVTRPTPRSSRIETCRSPSRDRADGTLRHRAPGSAHARAVLHRYLPAAGERRVHRDRPVRHRPAAPRVGVRRPGAAVPGGDPRHLERGRRRRGSGSTGGLPQLRSPRLSRNPASLSPAPTTSTASSGSSSPTWCTARPSSPSAARGSGRPGGPGFPRSPAITPTSPATPKRTAPWPLKALVGGLIARFHRRSRRVYTPSMPARTRPAPARRRPRSRSGAAGWTREHFHPGAGATRCARPSGWAAGSPSCTSDGWRRRSASMQVLEAFRQASDHGAAGRDPSRDRRHRAVRGRAPRRGPARRHLPRACSTAQSRLPDLYANADAFVFASVDRDAGPGRAGGDGQRPAGHRGARGRGRGPSARRPERHGLPGGRLDGDGAGHGAAGRPNGSSGSTSPAGRAGPPKA